MELAESLKKEEWISALTTKEKKLYTKYARNSLIKRNRINIRIKEFLIQDLLLNILLISIVP